MSSNVAPASASDEFTRNALLDGLGGFLGTKYDHTQPFAQQTPAAGQVQSGPDPIATADPFAGLASSTQPQQAPNEAFDSIVNDILNESPQIQGDTPVTQSTSEAPKTPNIKTAPLFGDLNINLPQPHTQVKTDEERNAVSSGKESIF